MSEKQTNSFFSKNYQEIFEDFQQTMSFRWDEREYFFYKNLQIINTNFNKVNETDYKIIPILRNDENWREIEKMGYFLSLFKTFNIDLKKSNLEDRFEVVWGKFQTLKEAREYILKRDQDK